MSQPSSQPSSQPQPPELEPFTRIRLGGMSADLDGYAYEIDHTGDRPRAYLWYVSMLGHKAAVQAIWAGLVNSPPQNVVLYSEEEDQNDDEDGNGLAQENPSVEDRDRTGGEIGDKSAGRKPILVAPVEGGRRGGWNFFKAQLGAACAFQGVLLPQIAFTEGTTAVGKSRRSGTVSFEGQEFMLLRPPAGSPRSKIPNLETSSQNENMEGLSQRYYTRLNHLVDLPLHPGWAEPLWQLAVENGEVKELECAGVRAYLCRKPDPQRLQEEVSDLIRLGKLTCR